MEAKKRGRPKKKRAPVGEPLSCVDCGSPGRYYTDQYGMFMNQWRCKDCHEQQCRRSVRHDYQIRYGDR